MNFGLKSKTFNIAGTPTVNPGVAIETALEPGARIVGVMLSTLVGGSAADTASFALYASVAGVNYVIANGNHSWVVVTFPGSTIAWWAGVSNQYKDHVVQAAGAAPNTVQGFFPLCPPQKWVDGVTAYNLFLQIITTGLGSAIVFYTLDPPTASGERA